MNKDLIAQIKAAMGKKTEEVEVDIKPEPEVKVERKRKVMTAQREEPKPVVKEEVVPLDLPYRVFLLEDESVRFIKLSNMIKEKYPKADIYIAKTYLEAKDILSHIKPKFFNLLLLDFDLADGRGNGKDVVRFLNRKRIKYDRAIIHSMNYGGSEQMRNELVFEKTSIITFPLMKIKYIEPLRSLFEE